MVTNFENYKIKPLTKSQIVISIDRLTRFKPTVDKYLRVFGDIVINNLITPSFKKKDLENFEFEDLKDIVEMIFNESLKQFECDVKNDGHINKILADYENSVFENNSEVNKLLDNKLNYIGALKLLREDDMKVKNLSWLSKLVDTDFKELSKNREKFALHFPISKIIIAEGITEEILLPIFAKIVGIDFDKYGFHIISAGGKNQVVKSFYSLSESLKIPIFVLLDNDAKENLEQIKPRVRKIDKIHLVQSGEFEDLLPISLILRTLNKHLKNLSSVSLEDFDETLSMVKNLEEIFKYKGLEEFKKAEFAHLIGAEVKNKSDLSDEVIKIINELKD